MLHYSTVQYSTGCAATTAPHTAVESYRRDSRLAIGDSALCQSVVLLISQLRERSLLPYHISTLLLLLLLQGRLVLAHPTTFTPTLSTSYCMARSDGSSARRGMLSTQGSPRWSSWRRLCPTAVTTCYSVCSALETYCAFPRLASPCPALLLLLLLLLLPPPPPPPPPLPPPLLLRRYWVLPSCWPNRHASRTSLPASMQHSRIHILNMNQVLLCVLCGTCAWVPRFEYV
jgi:hypothetical protein